MSTKPTLGYWDYRGLGQPIRNLLTYLGVDFNDRTYDLKPEIGKVEWLGHKFSLGLDFPNLPYYLDGDIKLTQSLAIIRYIARKYKLDGNTEQEKVNILLMEQQVIDFDKCITRHSYDPNFTKLKDNFLQDLPNQIQLLSKFLKDKPFIAGENISYCDFLLYEYLIKINLFVPRSLDQTENVKKYISRIESLPRVSAYLKNRKPKTFNSSPAKWNGTY